MFSDKDLEKFDEMVEESTKDSEGEVYCPRCGSQRVQYFLGFTGVSIYVCKGCGYRGPVVIEDGKLAEDIRKKWIEKKSG